MENMGAPSRLWRSLDLDSLFLHYSGQNLQLLPAETGQDADNGFDSYTNLIKVVVGKSKSYTGRPPKIISAPK